MSTAGGDSAGGAAANGAPARRASSVRSLTKKLGATFKRGSGSGTESRSERLRKDIGFTEHTWPVDKLFDHYGATPSGGLTSAAVLQNRARYGWNRLTQAETTPWWIKYLKCYADVFMILLLFGSLLCFVAFGIDQSDLTNLYLGVVLALVVVISATFGYYTESQADSIMEGFKKMVPKRCKVLRDGAYAILDAEELVPGDVVEINDGDQVPADVRVVWAQDCKVDNSSLTGESEAQERYPELARDARGRPITVPLEAANLMFYTTICTAGTARGVVIGTGDRTVMGQIAGLAAESGGAAKTQFQLEVDTFIHIISFFAVAIGVTFTLIGIFVAGASAIDMVVFAIGIIVGTVPEGLLVTLTVALALSAKNMYHKSVLVKGMPSVENLGSTTVVASDKTGTLTQNRMTVQHAWYDGALCVLPAARNRPQLRAALKPGVVKGRVFDPEAPTFRRLQMVASLCNNSRFVARAADAAEGAPPLDLDKAADDPEFNLLGLACTGDASESGLIKAVQLLRDVDAYGRACPKLHEIKFNSTNKWQLSVHALGAADAAALGFLGAHPVLVLKGAPERVLRMCTRICVDGADADMDADWQARYNEAYESLGAMGERVLGFAYRELTELPLDHAFTNKPAPNFPTEGLTFAGLLSLIDPPREGVPEAVAKCKRARIRVFMVTGDHPITAQAIAKQVGIIDDDAWERGRAVVIKGDDIRAWMDLEDPAARQAKWDWALDHEQIVFARVSPAHKLLIVENCQRRGENVAVTGDGVNDAPALKKANTGIAMGISGKDVSKDAADMILMDDNFASIVNGIEEGRVIFDNLKKSIAYTLASKLPEQIPFLLYVAMSFPLAISTILILSIDLGCDMLPAISLAYEPKEADIMDRPPRNPAVERLVSRRLISFSYFQIGLLQATAGFLAFMAVLNDHGYPWDQLIGRGIEWPNAPLVCRPTFPSGGGVLPKACGFGCGDASGDPNWCRDGCPAPFAGTWDPFVEMTPYGFRGYAPDAVFGGDAGAAEAAVCGRTCAWYAALPADTKASWIAAHAQFRALEAAGVLDPSDPFSYNSTAAPAALLLSAEEDALFQTYCGLPDAAGFGFAGRGLAVKRRAAPQGGLYWWGAAVQYWPNLDNQDSVLRTAQTAYFVAVVVARVGDLLVCKTRKESIFRQGMRNRVLVFGGAFMFALAMALAYVPFLNTIWGTRPLSPLYVFIGLPYFMAIMLYDEGRKALIRASPRGWVFRNTYW